MLVLRTTITHASCTCPTAFQIVASKYSYVQVSKLHKLLKPFLLRRIKSDVEDSLPAKQEILLYADMTKEQKKINQQLCDRSFIVSSPHVICSASACLVRPSFRCFPELR